MLEISDTSDEVTVAEALLEHLERGLHAKRAAVLSGGRILAVRGVDLELAQCWFADRDGNAVYSAIDKNDQLFPMRVPLTKRDSRWLLVGPRPDGSLYGKDERKTLYAIVAALGQALSAASRNSVQPARIEAIAGELRLLREKVIPNPASYNPA